jgi:hypothetical protein
MFLVARHMTDTSDIPPPPPLSSSLLTTAASSRNVGPSSSATKESNESFTSQLLARTAARRVIADAATADDYRISGIRSWPIKPSTSEWPNAWLVRQSLP